MSTIISSSLQANAETFDCIVAPSDCLQAIESSSSQVVTGRAWSLGITIGSLLNSYITFVIKVLFDLSEFLI